MLTLAFNPAEMSPFKPNCVFRGSLPNTYGTDLVISGRAAPNATWGEKAGGENGREHANDTSLIKRALLGGIDLSSGGLANVRGRREVTSES